MKLDASAHPAIAVPITIENRAESLCEPASDRHHVLIGSPLASAVEILQARPDLRLLPIVDGDLKPVGAIFEKDIRGLLFSPYGHALLRNPGFGRTLNSYRRDCPIADADTPVPRLLDIYTQAGGSEGMILTANGRIRGVLTARTLIRLAALREGEIISARARRLDRIEAEGIRFRAGAADLSTTLKQVADTIERGAMAMVDRATDNGVRAAAVAAASAQTSEAMLALAGKGQGLAKAIDAIGADTLAARAVAEDAAKLVELGVERTSQLTEAIRAIETLLALIDSLARRANSLAVNAAIEAARVGAAGDGFAVVAREVRQFASETRGAAGEITHRVGEIRATAKAVADGQRAIEQVVTTIGALARSVDSAIGAQAGTLHLLNESVGQAVESGAHIQRNVQEIGGVSDAAARGSQDMRALASRLALDAGRLHSRVDGFLVEIRAA